jgi:hypothetical protein
MVPSRYIVRRSLDEARYVVWDTTTNVVHSTDLGFDDALNLTDQLNTGEPDAIPAPPPSEPQHVAQQQQQPQPKKE